MPSPSPDKPMRRRSLGPRGGHLTHPAVRGDPTQNKGGRAREGSARHCGEGGDLSDPRLLAPRATQETWLILLLAADRGGATWLG